MPFVTAKLRAKAIVASRLSLSARDSDTAALLLEISQGFEDDEARERELRKRGDKIGPLS